MLTNCVFGDARSVSDCASAPTRARTQTALARLSTVRAGKLFWAAAIVFFGADCTVAEDIVFGSFARSEPAKQLVELVEARLGMDAEMVDVEVAGRRYWRVVARFGSEAAARANMAKAHDGGFTDAWYSARPVVVPGEDLASPPTGSEDPAPAPAVRQHAWRLTFATSGDPADAIDVPRDDTAVVAIDGRLDEAVWSGVPGHDNMVLVEPGTLATARHRTVARYFHSDRGLYIGVWNEQPADTLTPRNPTARRGAKTDGWGITLDTSGTGRYGHWFSVDLGDAVEPTARLWESATAGLDDGWSLEVFVPWTMLAMPPVADERVIGMYVNRKVAYVEERWAWPAVLAPVRDVRPR